QFQLGRLYAFSDLRNDALAVEWFLCAAKQDHSSAQFKLGWMYHLGMGVEQSDRQAFHWFILAAEQDHAGAQASLGEMYKNGWGVEQDDVAAQDWFYRARTMHYP
ncbi:tetratricopeptide repeat protein, partial [Enterobacter roggenkampii]